MIWSPFGQESPRLWDESFQVCSTSATTDFGASNPSPFARCVVARSCCSQPYTPVQIRRSLLTLVRSGRNEPTGIDCARTDRASIYMFDFSDHIVFNSCSAVRSQEVDVTCVPCWFITPALTVISVSSLTSATS